MNKSRGALLCGSKSTFDVMPWLDHGIQKIIKNTNFISIFNWVPRSSRRMTTGKLIHATKPNKQLNDSGQ
ncbi:MAG: hypothetical protein ACRYE8_04060 [Janthinobacterium lividum]